MDLISRIAASEIALLDVAAMALFAAFWLFYEPMLRRLSGGRGTINTDMAVIRAAWMVNMTGRENRFLDSQLMGHALNSASFFASANLIVIAAAAGVLFGGDSTYRTITDVALLDDVPRVVFEAKLALVTITLSRGLLDFIWAIRQMNYCLTAIGAAPEWAPAEQLAAYGRASAELLNPALASFNAGVRGYYFALAATAWLLGPGAFIAATAGAVVLLVWRQRVSPAAAAVRDIRAVLDARHTSGEAHEPPFRSQSPAEQARRRTGGPDPQP